MLDYVKCYTTYHELGGPPVTAEELRKELAAWPLCDILEKTAQIALKAWRGGQGFLDPEAQQVYYKAALEDDFPYPLPTRPVAPEVFIHQQNLAWLTDQALLHASRTASSSPDDWEQLAKRVCRLLLIINDFLDTDPLKDVDLRSRRDTASNWLRYGQFNHHLALHSSVAFLAREYRRYSSLPPEYNAIFYQALPGGLEGSFEALVVILAYLHADQGPTHCIDRSVFTSRLLAGQEIVESWLTQWTTTPEKYTQLFAEWQCTYPNTLPSFNYMPLRIHPLVELQPGKLTLPIPHFLIAQISDGPFFAVTDHLKGKSKPAMSGFHTDLGQAYENYAHGLLERIAQHDRKGHWRVLAGNPRCDTYFQRSDVGIAFEHKGGRPGNEFLAGGSAARVLGPSDDLLNKIDRRESLDCSNLSKKGDDGFLTQGIWQLARAARSIPEWAQRQTGVRPTRIYHIITYHADLRVDEFLRLAYLDPLMKAADVFQDSPRNLYPPQWLHVMDLEALAALAEQGNLDLEELLRHKVTEEAAMQFDSYCLNRLGYPMDPLLTEEAHTLMDAGSQRFFGRPLRRPS